VKPRFRSSRCAVCAEAPVRKPVLRSRKGRRPWVGEELGRGLSALISTGDSVGDCVLKKFGISDTPQRTSPAASFERRDKETRRFYIEVGLSLSSFTYDGERFRTYCGREAFEGR